MSGKGTREITITSGPKDSGKAGTLNTLRTTPKIKPTEGQGQKNTTGKKP